MRVVATLDIPTAGDALVDGFSVLNDPDRVRRRLGFMPDYFGTYANINCWEYLDFFARAYGLVGPHRQRALTHTMSFTGLDRLAEKPINGLSKGMKQRLCLGRAMIHDPSVLILDEPAAGLDPRARIELKEMIGQLAADGKSILISSHILTELGEMCDRVGIIEQGRLLATGTVEEILRGATEDQPDQKTQNRVEVRVLGGAQPLAAWLAQRPGYSELTVEGETLAFTDTGSDPEQAQLLKDMVLAGFSVVGFGVRHKSLEEVFMHVTRGVVQ
jgi:ABC-2 type transport system ATP-binding protein